MPLKAESRFTQLSLWGVHQHDLDKKIRRQTSSCHQNNFRHGKKNHELTCKEAQRDRQGVKKKCDSAKLILFFSFLYKFEMTHNSIVTPKGEEIVDS